MQDPGALRPVELVLAAEQAEETAAEQVLAAAQAAIAADLANGLVPDRTADLPAAKAADPVTTTAAAQAADLQPKRADRNKRMLID